MASSVDILSSASSSSVTKEELDYVAANIRPSESRRLLRKLGLNDVTIEQVFHDFEKARCREQLYQGLFQWWICQAKISRRSTLLVFEIRTAPALDTALKLRVRVNCKHRKVSWMDNKVTEEELDYVADNISPSQSRRLLRKLGLKDVTIDQVFYDFKEDRSCEQLYQGLRKCKEKKGSSFTLGELVSALKYIRREDLAEELLAEGTMSSEEDAKLIQSRVIQKRHPSVALKVPCGDRVPRGYHIQSLTS
ncbi:Hypp134 [Branchiostoma lanceolatum]|uniref:Hypp134 protein n=1 Tax=Branchiostoma lanceolatum TaxID=7740 RepID=A0A8J9YJA6_BRALA|nr:Hypp134 [Branchiostoma lanceolatum]